MKFDIKKMASAVWTFFFPNERDEEERYYAQATSLSDLEWRMKNYNRKTCGWH